MCDLDACEWLTVGLFGCYKVSKKYSNNIVIVFNKSFNLVWVCKRNKWLNKIWNKYEFIKNLEIH